ncbi:hypothetical protein VTK56DRAFT_1951 [Thermocarpiscus australiensis]
MMGTVSDLMKLVGLYSSRPVSTMKPMAATCFSSLASRASSMPVAAAMAATVLGSSSLLRCVHTPASMPSDSTASRLFSAQQWRIMVSRGFSSATTKARADSRRASLAASSAPGARAASPRDEICFRSPGTAGEPLGCRTTARPLLCAAAAPAFFHWPEQALSWFRPRKRGRDEDHS